MAVYCGTKYAAWATTEGLRLTSPPGIRVTTVSPGVVESELAATITDPHARDVMADYRRHAIVPTAIADAVADAVALAVGQPAEVDVNEDVVRPPCTSGDPWSVRDTAAHGRCHAFPRAPPRPEVLLMPNAWDVGSARILVDLGFPALATTSGGAAAARGLLDGDLDADATLGHCAEIAGAVDVPVSGDLEDCFAEDPAGVAAVVRRAREAGLAGVSIEDWDGAAVRPLERAVERVAAAVEGAAGAVVVTVRAENHFRGVDDLDDTVRRLRAYGRAGADVVYAPGVHTAKRIRTVRAEVAVPLNVLALPGAPPVAELAELGVRRVSVGAAFAFRAYAAVADAAGELAGPGTYGWLDDTARGRALAREAVARNDRRS